MAKAIRKKDQKRRASAGEMEMPLNADNFKILAAGIVTIVAGYLAMLEGSVEGTLPLVVSPILLVIGYCVVIPFGLLYRKGEKKAGTSPVIADPA